MKPTIGRVVVYNTTESERTALEAMGCNKSKQLPATIVAVWGDAPTSAVNLKVHVDGRGQDLWKTSLSVGSPNEAGEFPEGSWNWPLISPTVSKTVA